MSRAALIIGKIVQRLQSAPELHQKVQEIIVVPEIRRAKRADLESIKSWLADEDARGVQGCFFCNFPAIENGFRRKELIVLSEATHGKPVAFYVGNQTCLDILEVHDRFRSRGYGETLALHYLKELESGEAFGVVIECMPKSSAIFWESFGFRGLDDEPYRMVYLVRRRRQLPGRNKWQPMRFRVYSNDQLVETQFARAESLDGQYVIDHDFVCYAPTFGYRFHLDVDGSRVLQGPVEDLSQVGGERRGEFWRLTWGRGAIVICEDR